MVVVSVGRHVWCWCLIMGILGLSKLIADNAPSAVKENEMKNYFGEELNPFDFFFSLIYVMFDRPTHCPCYLAVTLPCIIASLVAKAGKVNKNRLD